MNQTSRDESLLLLNNTTLIDQTNLCSDIDQGAESFYEVTYHIFFQKQDQLNPSILKSSYADIHQDIQVKLHQWRGNSIKARFESCIIEWDKCYKELLAFQFQTLNSQSTGDFDNQKIIVLLNHIINQQDAANDSKLGMTKMMQFDVQKAYQDLIQLISRNHQTQILYLNQKVTDLKIHLTQDQKQAVRISQEQQMDIENHKIQSQQYLEYISDLKIRYLRKQFEDSRYTKLGNKTSKISSKLLVQLKLIQQFNQIFLAYLLDIHNFDFPEILVDQIEEFRENDIDWDPSGWNYQLFDILQQIIYK